MLPDEILTQVRDRFANVDECPIEGPRIFFENAGGALTLKSVVETTTRFAAIPDNQGRDNPASAHLMQIIAKSRADAHDFFGAKSGQMIVGESGTELLFRLIRTACVNMGGAVIGSTVEHPATRSAAIRWAGVAGHDYVSVDHDAERGLVTPDQYAAAMRPDVKVATILHTSPVSGMGMDLAGIVAAIRDVSPDCVVIVDGIQHAAHGGVDVDALGIDGYVVSPYKVFSRHGYGVAWLSDRLSALPHDMLKDGPELNWEFGTRDTGAYATWSDVVDYFDWLGGAIGGGPDRTSRLSAAAKAINDHEAALCNAMVNGTGNLKGLAELSGVGIIGGADNPAREGLVSLTVEGLTGQEVVEALRSRGIRTHVRKADHYSGGVLRPLGLDTCTRVSLCHYNSRGEVAQFLTAMAEIVPS